MEACRSSVLRPASGSHSQPCSGVAKVGEPTAPPRPPRVAEMPSKCPTPRPRPACVPVCKLSRVPRCVSCILRPSLLPFLSPSPSLSLCLSLFFYFPENQFEERAKGKKESARNPGINPGALPVGLAQSGESICLYKIRRRVNVPAKTQTRVARRGSLS